MTSPDRTDELILEMLGRRAGGDPPADLAGRTLLALATVPRPRGTSRLPATSLAVRRRSLALAATLLVAVPGLIAVLLAAGLLMAPSRGDDGHGAAAGLGTSPSATPAAAAATPRASAATPPSTGESPNGASPEPVLAVGSLAVVTIEGNGLRVRSEPSTADDRTRLKPLLPAGTRMLIIGGPVPANEMEWYEVQTDGELIDLFGWVSTGQDGERWLAPKKPRCPEVADAAAVATLNRIDFLACYGDTKVEVKARAADFWDTRLDTSDCGWVRRTGSCDVDTRWLLFPSASVTLVTDKGNEHQIDLAMPPDLTSRLQDVPRQATLLLTISMDAPESASCGVHDPVVGADLIPAHRAVTACRLHFVVQQIAWRDAGGAGTG
jgi:hypothetical protein